MLAALRVFRYLLNDPGQGIILTNSSDFSFVAYSDSNWTGYAESLRLVTDFFYKSWWQSYFLEDQK